MFCPNCGRNCGDDRFCADCGTRMPNSADAEKQQDLGADLTEITQKIPAGFPVKSSYIGERRTYLDLNETTLTVSPTGGYEHRVTIAYDQIKHVVFMGPEGSGWFARSGVLLFRGEQQSHIPVPAPEKMQLDDIAVFFPAESAPIFYHVYYILKLVAPKTARFEMIRRPGMVGKLDSLGLGIDFADLWERYALRRERAVEELQKSMG